MSRPILLIVFVLLAFYAVFNVLTPNAERPKPVLTNTSTATTKIALDNEGEQQQEKVFEKYNEDKEAKRKSLIDIFRRRLFSTDSWVPQRLLNASKGNLRFGRSLLSYLVTFLLTYNYDNKSPLFKVLTNRIDEVIKIAELRNEKGHGQTYKDEPLVPLSKDDAGNYYLFIKAVLTDYIQEQ